MGETTEGTRPAPGAPPTLAARRKILLAATLGNVVEFYDFTVYALMATVIAPLFFTGQSPTAALLSTLVVFAVPFLARPLGAVVFGHFGDRIGRKRVLVVTITLMGLGCGLIGALPTYTTVGVLAPVLLVLLRVLQGVSAGGEIGGAATYVVETAPEDRRGLFGGVLAAGPTAGVALAAGVTALLTATLGADGLTAGGWRLPFLLALPLALLALYIRLRLEDSPAFSAVEEREQVVASPLKVAVTRDRAAMLKVLGVAAVHNVGAYLTTVFAATYMTVNLGYPRTFAAALTSFGLLAVAVLIPLFGALSDRVGRRPVVAAGLVGYVVLTVPALLVMALGNMTLTVLAFFVLNVPNLLMQGAAYTLYTESFPTAVRYTGVSVAFNAAVVLGGAVPFLATLLIAATGEVISPGYVVIALAVVGLLSLRQLVETRGRPLA